MGYIYKITNLINGKSYIGQTRLTIPMRYKEHLYSIKKSDSVLYRAFRKYGIENFKVEQLEECDDEILNEREIYWIDKYDTFRHGYNATIGGGGNSKITSEIKQKTLMLWDDGLLNHDIADILGIHKSTVTKIIKHIPNYREISKARQIAKNVKRSEKRVQAYTSDGIFVKEYEGINAAARQLGEKSGGDIVACLKGSSNSAFGYLWKYADDPAPITIKRVGRNRPIKQYDMLWNYIKEYNSMVDAEKETGVKRHSILQCCQKRTRSAGNYRWCYAEESLFPQKVRNYKRKVKQMDKSGNIIKVYPSVSEAARQMNKSFASIQLCCSGRNKTAHGYLWEYID